MVIFKSGNKLQNIILASITELCVSLYTLPLHRFLESFQLTYEYILILSLTTSLLLMLPKLSSL